MFCLIREESKDWSAIIVNKKLSIAENKIRKARAYVNRENEKKRNKRNELRNKL